MKITTEGRHHLGGSTSYRMQYVNVKVEEWKKELKDLAIIACT